MKRFAIVLATGLFLLGAACAASAAPHRGPHHPGHGRYAHKAPRHGVYHYRHQVPHFRYHPGPRLYYRAPPLPPYLYPHPRYYRPVYPGCWPQPYSHGGLHIGGPHYSFGIHW
jgi:hypothetical protein